MQTLPVHNPSNFRWVIRWLIAFWMFAVPFHGQAQDFLAPERAFAMQARQIAPDVVAVSFKIAPKYYLYRERFELSVQDAPWPLEITNLPQGVVKYDPTFEKDMALHYGAVEFMIELPAWPVGQPRRPFALSIISQGCAEAGLCYPPMASAVVMEPWEDGYKLVSQQAVVDLDRPFELAGSFGRDADRAGFNWSDLFSTSSDTGIAQALEQGALWQLLLLFFGLGLLLAFTPCVLPMVPILSALIVGQQKHVNRLRGLSLAAAYVAGMSVVYTVLGVLAGLTGAGLAAWLQAPWVLALFALLLVLLGLAMFDVIKVQMPSDVQSQLNQIALRFPGGKLTAAAAMGAISALIVGPCVAAPLAGALLYISQTGDVILGGSALFSMAWGMGVPLLLVGMSAGTLIPKAGAWMDGVKAFFGLLLFATAWWMVNPIVSPVAEILGWTGLAVLGAVLLGAFEPLAKVPDASGSVSLGAALRKTMGLLLAAIAVLWLVGLASGGKSLMQPLGHISQWGVSTSVTIDQSTARSTEPKFVSVQSVSELDQLLKSSTQPVMLDFYADWCVSCKEMEAFTFTSPEVAQKMNQFLLLKADVTANNADHRALLRRFNLFGPPGIMFFEPGGRYRDDARVIGFQDAQRFSASLDKVLRNASQ